MPRCPLYVGLEVGIAPASLLPDATTVQPSTIGGDCWEIAKGGYRALIYKLGVESFQGTSYRIYSVLVTRGEQFKVYRWLKNNAPPLVGPYDLSTAPAKLITFLEGVTSDGVAGSPVVLSGEDRAYQDSLQYVEGANPNGDDDAVIEL